MVKKQIYSIVNYNEAVQVMDAGADHIGLVPMQSGGVPAHRVPYDVVDKIFGEAKQRGKGSCDYAKQRPGRDLFYRKKNQAGYRAYRRYGFYRRPGVCRPSA